MTHENLLVRVLGSCETMANASVVCTGMTGTLTRNVMSVVAGSVGIHTKFVRQLDCHQTRVPSYAEEPGTNKHVDDFYLDQTELNAILTPQLQKLFNEAIAINSTAFETDDTFVGSKTETALLSFAKEIGWESPRSICDNAEIVQMIPFSSKRKTMGVVVKLREGSWRLYVKGASEILSKKCTSYVAVHTDGQGVAGDEVETAPIDRHAEDNVTRTIDFYANQMLRTVCLCYRDLNSWPPMDVFHNSENEVYIVSILCNVPANRIIIGGVRRPRS